MAEDPNVVSRRVAQCGAAVLGTVVDEVDQDPITKRNHLGRERTPADRRYTAMCLAAGSAVGVCVMRASEIAPDVDWLSVFLATNQPQEQTDGTSTAGTSTGDRVDERPGSGEGSGGVPPGGEGADGAPTEGAEPQG